LHDDEDIGANFNFSEKSRKYENSKWRTAAILKTENNSATHRPIFTNLHDAEDIGANLKIYTKIAKI